MPNDKMTDQQIIDTLVKITGLDENVFVGFVKCASQSQVMPDAIMGRKPRRNELCDIFVTPYAVESCDAAALRELGWTIMPNTYSPFTVFCCR